MKILSLKARGFVGFSKGMGLNEIALDLSGLSGLVALEGANGKGKTSCLELMSPYRTLASRKKGLQHHVFLKDSFKELTFEFDGHTYNTLIKIDPETEKQEGFIWKDGESQVNGKVKDYDRYIETLLGSERLFFNSIFCSQNSDKISDMTTGELKSLFSEFLRLDRYIDFETTSKQCINILDFRAGEVDKKIEKLNELVGGIAFFQEHLEAEKNSKQESQKALIDAKAALITAEISLENNQKTVQKNELIREKIKSLTSEKDRVAVEIEEAKTTRDKALQERRVEAQSKVNEITRLDKVLTDKEKIQDAVNQTNKAKDQKEKITETLNALIGQEREISTTINKMETGQADTRAKIKELQGDNKAALLRAEIKQLERQTEALLKRDPLCESSTCSFIIQALEASKRFPQANIELDQREKEIREAEDKLKSQYHQVEAEVSQLANQRATILNEMKFARDQMKAHDKVILENSGWIPLVDQITKAETLLEGLKARKQELIDEGMKLKAQWDETILRKETVALELSETIATSEKNINLESDQAVIEGKKTIEAHKALIQAIEKDLKEIDIKIAGLETKLKERDAAKIQVEAANKEKAALMTEMQEWTYLKNACGKDGLRALEIDSVAPVITGYANNLLQETFGPMFSVRFRTQNDEGKEVLDILVIREDGTEVLLDNLSGGEKVWLLKSLRLAMTLISKEKSGRNYNTLLCDEEDGPLSKDNATQFIMLYRSVMQLAGMDTCFYISHRPEALAMADHRLVFGDHGIEVE